MSLDDLIAQATSRVPGNKKCWAAGLEGDTQKFVAALQEVEDAQPGAVNRRQAQRILAAEFGISISKETVRSHFAGDCRCGR